MKRRILLIFIIFCFLMTGCSLGDVKKQKEINEIVEVAIEDSKIVTYDSIYEAIEYIDMHIIEPIDDIRISKKMIYYGTYLAEIGHHSELGLSMLPTLLGVEVKDYISKLYLKEAIFDRDHPSKEYEFILASLEEIKLHYKETIEAFLALS